MITTNQLAGWKSWLQLNFWAILPIGIQSHVRIAVSPTYHCGTAVTAARSLCPGSRSCEYLHLHTGSGAVWRLEALGEDDSFQKTKSEGARSLSARLLWLKCFVFSIKVFKGNDRGICRWRTVTAEVTITDSSLSAERGPRGSLVFSSVFFLFFLISFKSFLEEFKFSSSLKFTTKICQKSDCSQGSLWINRG